MTKVNTMLLALIALQVNKDAAYIVDDCPSVESNRFYYQIFGDMCYEFIINHIKTYDDAEADCESRGGTLATVNSQDTQDFLYKTLTTSAGYLFFGQNHFWIGLNDQNEERKFIWEDGTPYGSYSNWASGEGPDSDHIDAGNEDCAAMNPLKHGQWFDHNCNENVQGFQPVHLPYFCQYKPLVVSTTTSTTTEVTTAGSGVVTSCPQFSCGLDCGTEGYKIDEHTGCSLCECKLRPIMTVTTMTTSTMTTSSLEMTPCPAFKCDSECDIEVHRYDENTGCPICECMLS